MFDLIGNILCKWFDTHTPEYNRDDKGEIIYSGKCKYCGKDMMDNMQNLVT